MKNYTKFNVINSMTGELVPLAMEILISCVKMIMARDNFLLFNEVFDHENVFQASIYIKLLDAWDLAVKEFIPYVNIYCCALYGYSLN